MTNATPDPDHELVLTRMIDAPREKLFRAWTEPKLMKQWFAPKPWTIIARRNRRAARRRQHDRDAQPGRQGLSRTPASISKWWRTRRSSFTDAYTEAWEPSDKPFMTGHRHLRGSGGGKTRYTARGRHWTAEDRETHEKMGFHAGLGPVRRPARALSRRILGSD